MDLCQYLLILVLWSESGMLFKPGLSMDLSVNLTSGAYLCVVMN